MKINQPVTGKQYDYPASEQLVSVTDLKGIIRYCNPAFIKVSGFTSEALIGQPHNIIRHPDMPPAAFADMWSTLRSGKPWTALVKNRRLNGDYYWVRANVTPIVERGNTVAYLSVRIKPSAEEVAAVVGPYAALLAAKDGAPAAYTLRKGRLLHAGIRGWLQRMCTPSVAARTGTALAAPVLATVVTSGILAIAGGAPLGTPWLSFLVLLGASAISGYWLTRTITQPLDELIQSADSLAACDLTRQNGKQRRDEFGGVQRALTQLRANLSAVVADVSTQAGGVRSAVQEIAAGNADLAARTERQAVYLHRTKDAVQALHAATGITAQHVIDTAETAREAASAAGKGEIVIGNVISTMANVAQSSQRVRDITSIIDGIAFQTNLLALNAAVEAARAGEHGKSFAVVAGEVQLLAKRCADASREISTLVTETVEQVQKSTVMANEAGATMHAIVDTISRNVEGMRQLEATGQQQRSNINEVEAAVSELDVVTQQNATLVEEVSASANNQREQTSVLTDAVNIFTYNGKLGIDTFQADTLSPQRSRPRVTPRHQPHPA